MMKEKARSDSMQNFTSTMSHEFRTPLGTCIMFLATLLSSIKEQKHRHICHLIDSQLKFLLSLVNDVIDLRQVQDGVLTAKSVVFDPLAVFTYMKEVFKPQLKRAKIVLKTICVDVSHFKSSLQPPLEHSFKPLVQEKLPRLLKGDEIRLKQVLINLIKNSIKFTKQYGRITVFYAFEEPNLFVNIADSGVGIAEQDMHHLFKQFGKLKRTAEMNSEGIGLGLMISNSLVQANFGTLKAHSRGIGHGSQF